MDVAKIVNWKWRRITDKMREMEEGKKSRGAPHDHHSGADFISYTARIDHMTGVILYENSRLHISSEHSSSGILNIFWAVQAHSSITWASNTIATILFSLIPSMEQYSWSCEQSIDKVSNVSHCSLWPRAHTSQFIDYYVRWMEPEDMFCIFPDSPWILFSTS